jgi:hypothetical protein
VWDVVYSLLEPPKNDELSNFRIDQGHVFNADATKYSIVVQPNAQAKSQGVKEFIKKNSTNAKLATAVIDRTTGDPSVVEIAEALERDFERRKEENDYS